MTTDAPVAQDSGDPPTTGERERRGPVLVGTSGWVYRDWREHVYPGGLPQRAWLSHLSRRMPTIEINASFYRLPSANAFAAWASQVPTGFVFSVKMSRYLTHVRRLRDPADPISRFWERAGELRGSLGPVLFQLPPTLPRDAELLRDVLVRLPRGMRAAFEFRHASWVHDDVLNALDEAGAAFVLAHRPRARVPMHVTGGWSYVRFHRGTESDPAYRAATLRRWRDRLLALPADPVYAYFNNDQGGAAVHDAERLTAMLAR